MIYSGLAPQVTGIQEEMMFGWTPSLPTNAVSMGTAMKRLGYRTAYFGKFELDRDIVFPKPGVNYAGALKKYGFDVWQPYGEVTGEQNQGYQVDGVIGAEGIRWLRTNANRLRKAGEPWFLVLSFINHPDLTKRGFVAMTFDGRYKFARYYAPSQFNTPRTLEEILVWNDLELFDLHDDPEERNNLALEPKRNEALILRMNALLNELMAREVGVNDGEFLPAAVRPKGSLCCEGAATVSPR